MHRIIRRMDLKLVRGTHPLHVGSSGERRLRSFLPKCHLSSSKLRVLTPRHVFTPPPRTTKGLSPEQHLGWLALQAEEPMLTLLASASTRTVLHFTSRGTFVDLACIPDLAHKPRNQC